MADIYPAPRSTDPFDAQYDITAILTVLKMNPDNPLLVVPDQLKVLDVTLFFEDTRQAGLHP